MLCTTQLLVDKEAPTVPPIPACPPLQSLLTACLQLECAARPKAEDVVQVCCMELCV
jgi:hypothetical protein